MKFSQKLICFLNNPKTCMTYIKNKYENPYKQYSYERGNFYETTITHYPRISGVNVVIVLRKYETHEEVHNITVECYGQNHWANECPTEYARRERMLNFLYKEINN
jgi:hypothetical protein